MRDLNNDGIVSRDELETLDITYWDFVCAGAVGEAGRVYDEYCFVEKKERSGEFVIYVGELVHSQNVNLL